MSTCLVVVEEQLEVVLLANWRVTACVIVYHKRDRQRLVDSFEAGEDCLHLANQLGINYSTARSIIWVWLQDGRRRNSNIMLLSPGTMDEAIGEISLATPFTTSDFLFVNSGTSCGWPWHLNQNCWGKDARCRRSFQMQPSSDS